MEKVTWKQFGKWRISGDKQIVSANTFLNLDYPSQTTKFRLFQTERVCKWKFQFWWKWQTVLQKDAKHCGKRRNCLFQTKNIFISFFFSHIVFKRLVLQTGKNQGLFGKGLTEKELMSVCFYTAGTSRDVLPVCYDTTWGIFMSVWPLCCQCEMWWEMVSFKRLYCKYLCFLYRLKIIWGISSTIYQ